MRVKKAIMIIVCIFILNISFIFKAYSQEPEKLKVYYQPVISWAPLIIAYEEGFFKEEGIDIEFVKARDVSEALILLLQGSLDVAFGPPTAGLYNAISAGKNIKLVSGATFDKQGKNFSGICIKDDSAAGLDNSKSYPVKNLKDKKIGVHTFGSLHHYLLDAMFKKNGVLLNDANLVVMDFPSTIGAIERGIVYAGILAEPFVTLLKEKCKISFLSFADEFPNNPTTFMFYGSKLLSKNPDLGNRFIIAYLKGYKQYNEGKSERNVIILKKYIGSGDELLRKMEWPVIYPESIFYAKELLKNYQDWLIEKDYINKKIPVESMLDKNFLQKRPEGATK